MNHFCANCCSNSIEWIRTVPSQNSEDEMNSDSEGCEKPVDKVLVYLRAQTMGELAKEDKLVSFVQNARKTHPDKTIIYLLEGVNDFLKAQKVRVDHDIRNGITNSVYITKDTLDKILIWLQVEAKAHVRQTNSLQVESR